MTRIEQLERRIDELEARQAATETLLCAGAALVLIGMRAAALDAGRASAAEALGRLVELLDARLSQHVTGVDELLAVLGAPQDAPLRPGLRLVTDDEGEG